MPKLPTRTADIGPGVISGGRQASATDFGGADISGAVHAVQRVGEGLISAKEDDESRKVLVSQAEIRAKYAKRLDNAVTSGEDLDKIRSEMDNDLSKSTEGLQTKKGAETAALHTANTGSVFDNQANNIRVQRATIEARVGASKFLNSTGAIVASNPAYLPQAEKDVDAYAALLTNIPPAKRAEIAEDLKQNMNVAAAMANARLDPEGVKAAVEGGSYNMTPTQRQQVIHQADRELGMRRADEARIKAQEKEDRRDRDEAATDATFKGIMGGTMTGRQILDNPDLKASSKIHMVALMESRAKEGLNGAKKSNPTVVRDLWIGIHAPDGDPRKIYTSDKVFAEVAAGRVNTTDANQLNALVANQKDENNRSYGQRLGGRMQVIVGAMRSSPTYQAQPELAAAVQLELMARVEKKAAELRKAGTSPDALLDPENKDYFFKPGTIKAVADDVQAQMRAANPPGVDLRVTPDAVSGIEVGQHFTDPKGNPAIMTAALKAALKKQAPTPPSDFDAWMQATGGVLKPGQTQAQAVVEWKARQ